MAVRAQIQSDNVQVSANRTALAGVREEERVGQRTLLDVLDAELELLNSEVQLYTTRRNLVVTNYTPHCPRSAGSTWRALAWPRWSTILKFTTRKRAANGLEPASPTIPGTRKSTTEPVK